ncbi:MAG: 30S ribosomal protein S17 [Candidatus Nanoarchaeia archaeon]|jgi:small subunit ribosomal protein S17
MVGIKGVEAPKKECEDIKCPFHGELSVRGRTFMGTVKSDKMTNTVSVVWQRIIRIPKYKRYVIKKTSVKAHNPECINAQSGDKVLISECRPLSKTKKFVVLKVVND